MFLRSILIPSLLICAISAPFLLSEDSPESPTSGELNQSAGYSNQFAPFAENANSPALLPNAQFPLHSGNNNGSQLQNQTPSRNLSTQTQYARSQDWVQPARFSATPPTNLAGDNRSPAHATLMPSHTSPAMIPFGLAAPSAIAEPQFNQASDKFATTQPPPSLTPLNGPTFEGMTPDYGAMQTIIFSGDANGPDLESTPLEFMPIADFNEIFRWDISRPWVQQRWKRVSTNPGDVGLHGLRVALVTGTNSWDLHGSLTYYFDAQQRLQRITFRGWTGDATRLLQLLVARHQFQSQQTQLAGFFIAENRRHPTGGVLMKNPPVLYAENPVQQLAIVMEMNNPASSFELSEEFKALIAGSQQQ